MTEDLKGGESHYVPERERQKVINTFRQNFGLFLNGQDDATLINVSFVLSTEKLLVSHFIGINPAPFEYRNLNEEFVGVIKPFIKDQSIPMTLNDSHVLAEFDKMPESLRHFIGKVVESKSTIFDMTSLDGEKSIVTSIRYYQTQKDGKQKQIAEIWKARRYKQDQDVLGKTLPQAVAYSFAPEDFITAS